MPPFFYQGSGDAASNILRDTAALCLEKETDREGRGGGVCVCGGGGGCEEVGAGGEREKGREGGI